MSSVHARPSPTFSAADAMLHALPHPVIMVAPDGTIADANVAAEHFFEASIPMLRRHMLRDLVPFGSPLLALIEQVRQRGSAVNEYKVDLGNAAQSGRAPGRSARRAAGGIARRTSSSCCRSARSPTRWTGSSRIAAPRARSPRSPRCWRMRSKIRFPAFAARRSCSSNRPSDEDRALTQLICDETDRIVKLVDRMEVFADERPVEREPVNIHVVLDHVKRLAQSGFAPSHQIRRGVRSVAAAGARQPRPAGPGVSQSGEERRRGDRRRRAATAKSSSPTAFRPGVRLVGARQQDARVAAAGILRQGQRPGRAGRPDAASVRSVRHHEAAPAAVSALRWSRKSSAITAASSNAIAAAPNHLPRAACRCTAATATSRRAPHRLRMRACRREAFWSPTTTPRSARCSTRRCRARVTKCARPATPRRYGAGSAQGDGDLVITDVVMPDENAFDLLPRIRKARPDLPIIVMSAQNTFMTAIRASERGAYEYLPKPFDLKELIAIVGRALAEPKERAPAAAKNEDFDCIPLVGRSPAMQEIYRVLARLMQTDLTVMISRRIRHRQGTRGARAARLRQAPQRTLRRRQHGGDPARPDRIRIVRPREGRLHRRQHAQLRPLRAGGRRHAVSRRDRRHADGSADAAAARAAAGRIHAPSAAARRSRATCASSRRPTRTCAC